MKVIKNFSNRASAGFTLVELMITLAIAGIIVSAIYSAYTAQQRTYLAQEQVAEMQQNLRAGLILMARDIRMAGYDKEHTGNYGITTATNSKLVFAADLNDDGGAAGSGEIFTYELYTPGGAGMTALRRIAGQASIADDIQAIEFRYLDAIGADLANASGTVSSGSLSDIRSVQISILARAGDPDRKFTNTMVYCPASNPLNPATGQCTNPAPAAIWGPYNDNYRRRLLITTVNCRNMGL